MAAVNIPHEYSCTYKFQCALAQPISRRCDEIISLMNECNFKDANSLFPLLVESIFGFGSHSGWGVGQLFRNVRDFDVLRYFLCPTGPLMRFINKLNSDIYLKYEFATHCLPIPIQKTFDSGIIPSIYQNKLQAQSPGKMPTYLLLNPFEFFIFHLAYFLIGSHSQKNNLEWKEQGECLYVHLIEDYLHHFLPCDSSMTPISPLLGHTLSPSGKTIDLKSCSSFHGNKQSALRLFKQMPTAKQSLSSCVLSKEFGNPELWRNEVVAQAFIDLWLNHFVSESHHGSRSSPDKTSFFPSCVHVSLVRMLVKHIIYFSNNASPVPMNAFDDLKKAIIPHLLQKRLYHFIKHLFDHWPLDASFKLVLELWLSYIQPWRYVNMRANYTSTDKSDERGRIILSSWQPYVEENIMFYSVFFQKMVQRLLRVDLVSPKHAQMLHRVCKVFSQSNLNLLIKVAESLVIESMFRILPASSISTRSLLARAANEASHANAVRQHISELEGPNYNYSAMFGENSILLVKQLLYDLHRAKTKFVSSKTKTTQEKKSWYGNCVSSLESFFLLDYEQPNVKSEEEKIGQFLEYGLIQLSNLFQIEMQFEDCTAKVENLNSSVFESRIFEDSADPDSPVHKCIELLNKSRKPYMEYLGNPDLQLIRSYEIGPLVRILHQLSTLINDQFALEMQHLYERKDFVGRLSRQIIQHPRLCSSDLYHGSPSFTRERVLPPRISLRCFASKQNVGYVSAAYGATYVLGLNLFTATLIFMLCSLIFIVFKAFVDPQQSQPHTTLDRSPKLDFSDSSLRANRADNLSWSG